MLRIILFGEHMSLMHYLLYGAYIIKCNGEPGWIPIFKRAGKHNIRTMKCSCTTSLVGLHTVAQAVFYMHTVQYTEYAE